MARGDPLSLGLRPKFAVTFTLPGVDPDNEKEIQRAPDSSGSSGTFSRIAIIGGDQTEYTDVLPNDGTTRWYRWRWRFPSAPGHEGDWSSEFSATPRRLKRAPATFSEVQREADNATTTREALQHIQDTGYLKTTILHGSGFPVQRHNEEDTDIDGTTSVSFPQAYDSAPTKQVVPADGARTYVSADSGNDQHFRLKLSGLDRDGFDELIGEVVISETLVAVEDGFSSTQNAGAPEDGDVILSSDGDEAFSNLEDANATAVDYVVWFDVDTTGLESGSSITLRIYHNDGATSTNWTEATAGSWGSGQSLSDQKLSFNAALGTDFDIRAVVEANLQPPAIESFSVTMHGEDHASEAGVQYNRNDGENVHSMSPSGDTSKKLFWQTKDVA